MTSQQHISVYRTLAEHGVGTDDDSIRSWRISTAPLELKKVMDEGIPVQGYTRWSLLDDFEWIVGCKPKFGSVAVRRQTFRRTPKPSASVLGVIAQRNAL